MKWILIAVLILVATVALAKIDLSIQLGLENFSDSIPIEEGDALLLQSGDYLLLEIGDKLLLE